MNETKNPHCIIGVGLANRTKYNGGVLWTIKVYHIVDIIARIIKYLYQNIEGK